MFCEVNYSTLLEIPKCLEKLAHFIYILKLLMGFGALVVYASTYQKLD